MTKKQRLVERGIDPRLYAAWTNMKQRCNNPKTRYFKDYGGRGISYDPCWEDFAIFATEMGPHPGDGWTLDRKKNQENYRRGNCRWATPLTQANNRRDASDKVPAATRVAIQSEVGTCRGLGKKYGVSHATIARIKTEEVL